MEGQARYSSDVAFADFAGNRQYITQGNLQENPRTHLFLIDHANRRRIKIRGTARVVEGDEALVRRLMPADHRARPEQVLPFNVAAWDVNCPQHIPQRFEAADVAAALESRDQRIAAPVAEVRRLREHERMARARAASVLPAAKRARSRSPA